MAKAPPVKKGGHDAAAKRAERARETFRVGVKDSEFEFFYQPYNLPVSVRATVRDVTKKTVEVLLYSSVGRDVSMYCDVWWISRLASGEKVSREQVQSEWDEQLPGVTLDDITEEQVAHPEA